jgi:hypothetical protein
MKLVYALLALAVLNAPREGDELRANYREGRVFKLQSDDWLTMEVDEVAGTLNGGEMPPEMLEEFTASMKDERTDERVVTTTWIDSVEDGRPVRARRRFDEAAKTKLEGDEETVSEGVLVGRTLRLDASDDEEAPGAEFVDDDDGPAVDDVYLENHQLTPESDLYLPDKPVEVGDRWELDDAIVLKLLRRKGPVLFEPDAEDDEDEFDRVLAAAAEVAGTIEYVAKERVEGVECAVLVLTIEVRADDVDLDPETMGLEAEEGLETSVRMSLTMEGTERLWFAIDDGFALRREAEMEGTVELSMVLEFTELGMKIELDVTMNMAGAFTSSTAVE